METKHVIGCGCMKPEDQPCVGQRQRHTSPFMQQLLGMLADLSGAYDPATLYSQSLQQQQYQSHSMYVAAMQNAAQSNLYGQSLAQDPQYIAQQQQAAMQQRDLAIKQAIAKVNDADLVRTMEATDEAAKKAGFSIDPWYLAFTAAS